MAEHFDFIEGYVAPGISQTTGIEPQSPEIRTKSALTASATPAIRKL
jgi:hypothetical protein